MAESGHVVNVENLKTARDFAVSWGANYAPSNPLLVVASMSALITSADAALDDVIVKRTPWRNATADADDVFDPLSKLVTRIMKMLRGSGASESVIEDAETYARKIQGRRAEPKPPDDPSTPGDESAVSISASQMSRDQRIENFDKLIDLLESEPLYDPNEVDLQTATLNTLSNDLKTKTNGVGTTFVPYSNSLAGRDDVLYLNDNNVVKVGKLFKIYVEAAFGRTSTEWLQIKGLEFRDYRRT